MSNIDRLIEALENSNTITVKLTNNGRGTVILKEGTSLPSGETMSLEELKISKSEFVSVIKGSAIKFFVGETPRVSVEKIENSVKKKEPTVEKAEDNEAVVVSEALAEKSAELVSGINRDTVNELVDSDDNEDLSPDAIGSIPEVSESIEVKEVTPVSNKHKPSETVSNNKKIEDKKDKKPVKKNKIKQ